MIIERDLSGLSTTPDRTIREGLARINATPHLLQLIVDRDRILVGTLTDGDIRRALVKGFDLDSPIDVCMHHNPVVSNTIEHAFARLRMVEGRVRFVPVVDEGGRPVLVVIDSSRPSKVATAVIMAGGFGRRLREHTRETPKPLLSVRGRPILEQLIERLVSAGVCKIYIAVHYRKEQIEDFVSKLNTSAELQLIEETIPLGTAGALGLLPELPSSPLLLLNGDILTRTDFGAMMAFHQNSADDLTVGAARYEFEVPFGVIEHDGKGRLKNILEKPRHKHFVAAGIYILEPSVCSLVESDQRIDMPDLIKEALIKELRVGIFPIHEYWLDVGRPEDLLSVQQEDDE